MNPIPNIDIYTKNMRKSMIDKLFFMGIIDFKYLIDYGCADGTLLKFVKSIFPECVCIGYDISEEMIKKAKENNPDNIFFSTDWEECISKVFVPNTAILLSSVIHEFYAYLGQIEIKDIWNRIYNTGFSYIVIRDIMVSESVDRESTDFMVRSVINSDVVYLLDEFEKEYGSIKNNENLLHFLLKYRYVENWKRELKENYGRMIRKINIPHLNWLS